MMDNSEAPDVKLICAVTYTPDIDLDEVIASLEGAFGLIDGRSAVVNFNHTDYYAEEMGGGLKKLILSFEHPFKADNLWLAKRTANDIESIYQVEHKRRVNLDPGYLELSKLVLASTKNFSHRIYLNQGIYGEVTLLFADGKFTKLPWTYPDYLENEFQTFLLKTRELFKKSV